MTIWRIRIACRIPKATYTHWEYVIYIAFPLQQWLHKCASMVRFRYLAWLVLFITFWLTKEMRTDSNCMPCVFCFCYSDVYVILFPAKPKLLKIKLPCSRSNKVDWYSQVNQVRLYDGIGLGGGEDRWSVWHCTYNRRRRARESVN